MNEELSIWVATMFWAQNFTAWLGFVQQFESGRAIVQHEITWIGKTERAAAVDIDKLMKAHKIETEYNLLDPNRFAKPKESGESVAEAFSLAGFPCMEGNGNLSAGLPRLRSWFEVLRWPDGVNAPGLQIHERCEHLIRTLPSLMSEPDNPDELVKTVDAAPTIALSYWAMSRPLPATPIEIPAPEGSLFYDVEQMRRAASQE